MKGLCITFLICLPNLLNCFAFLGQWSPNYKRYRVSASMVRNIDLPECIIFYGRRSCRAEDDGFASFMDECKETDTSVVLIDDEDTDLPNQLEDLQVFPIVYLPPNPHDILKVLERTTVQPRPFGGSAGFGSKLPDPPRNPLPERTVILCTTLEATQAARAVGTRVISFEDNHLADAVVDELDFWLDDIATPGSFWLNPPTPKDDDGNRVDPEWLAANMVKPQNDDDGDGDVLPAEKEEPEAELDGDELQRILGDIAPL